MTKLKISTINVRGLIDNNSRNITFRSFKEENIDIIGIQETHVTKDHVSQIKNDWKGQSYFCFTDSSFSRGVGFLFKEGNNVEIIKQHSSDDGRIILLQVVLNAISLTLLNIYAPNNEKDRISFYNKVKSWINRYCDNDNELILLGDVNCCLREIDRSKKTHLKDKSRDALQNLMKKFDMVDVWNYMFPNKPGYSWENGADTIRSRLDYIFVSQAYISKVKCINLKYVPNTDHKMLYVDMIFPDDNKGKGYWKFNATLLENESYVFGVNKIIENAKRNKENIKSKRIRWEILKIKIKEFSIQLSVKLSRKKKVI